MRRGFLGLALVVGLAVIIMLGCSGSNSFSPAPTVRVQTGSVVFFGTDAPLCNVVSFEVTITGLTLTPQGGGAPVTVISGANPVTVDFASLVGFATILKMADIPVGTYSQLSITLASPQLSVLDVTVRPPAPTILSNTTLTSASFTLDINPPLVVTDGGVTAMTLDLDLVNSVKTDEHGQVTGVVAPVFQVSPTPAAADRTLGELDSLRGVVKSVSTSSTDPGFTGSFVISTRGGTGQDLTLNVNGSTLFEGVTGLSGLDVDTMVDVVAQVNSTGKILATEVHVLEPVVPSLRRAGFAGLVSWVNRDQNGNALEFDLFNREQFPDVSTSVPRRVAIRVRILPTTRFGIAALAANRAGLHFTPASLGEGQQLAVVGQYDQGSVNGRIIVNARAIFLTMNAYLGNVSQVLAVGSDGKTGGFAFVPCAPVFGGQPFTALTFARTQFHGIADLNSLGTQPLTVAKGLLLFEQRPGSVNGVTWNPPPPVYVLDTKMVAQRPPAQVQ